VKLNLCIAAVILLTGIASLAQQTGAPTAAIAQTPEERAAAANSALTKSIADILLAFGTLKPGMTRADVLKIFTEEGGLSWRMRHTYVYRGCPYVKVDVEFALAPGTENKHADLNEDTIVKISQPYLQWSVAD
jgi:hypothetical protein